MQVTVVGTGNVGSALLFPLAGIEDIDRICVMSRKQETAMAAIMDVASANPAGALKLAFQADGDLANADVIVVTSGVMQKGKTAQDTHKENLRIALDVINRQPLKKSAIIICLATPVDDLTVEVQQASGLLRKQVLGFGGDLDTNRLRFILQSHKLYYEFSQAVGEHGPNAIPVYAGEEEYSVITQELHQFWGNIANNVDIVRNLATADLLAKVVNSVVTDSLTMHNVCGYHPEYDFYVTWPYAIGRYGVEEPLDLTLTPHASRAFHVLLEERKQRLASITAR